MNTLVERQYMIKHKASSIVGNYNYHEPVAPKASKHSRGLRS